MSADTKPTLDGAALKRGTFTLSRKSRPNHPPRPVLSLKEDIMANDDQSKDKATEGRDSPKPHGDKFAAVGGQAPTIDDKPGTGDSPKRQGDPMEKVIRSDKG